MQTVTSKDGTTIAYEKTGQGPAVILVGGAFATRSGGAEFAEALAPHFTVYSYDRRGRGDSGDTKPVALDREVEDIAAMIEAAGGSASLVGFSSGAALAFEAASKLSEVDKLAMYEPPYNDDPAAVERWKEYLKKVNASIAADDRGETVTHFIRLTGASDEDIAGMRETPMWADWEALAPTLAYDNAAIGEEARIPAKRAAALQTPTIVMAGSDSFPFMLVTAKKLSELIPNAQYRELEGQTHEVKAEVITPVFEEFLTS